ncbi:hypothetical protein STEG23_027751, partial [Scotinomys teguina]
MYLSLSMGSTECILLAVMAYDRYVAICNPLRYPNIMNRQVCVQMATVSWVTGCVTALLETSFALQIPLCGNVIDHFTCEILAVLKLACMSSLLMDMVMLVISVLLLPIPMLLICVSYGFILSTILRISSTEGRNKAFSTCGAHLTVVILYYGAALSMYLKPSSSNSQEIDKIISLLYGVLTPMLNPIIYSLRNKEGLLVYLNCLSGPDLTLGPPKMPAPPDNRKQSREYNTHIPMRQGIQNSSPDIASYLDLTVLLLALRTVTDRGMSPVCLIDFERNCTKQEDTSLVMAKQDTDL